MSPATYPQSLEPAGARVRPAGAGSGRSAGDGPRVNRCQVQWARGTAGVGLGAELRAALAAVIVLEKKPLLLAGGQPRLVLGRRREQPGNRLGVERDQKGEEDRRQHRQRADLDTSRSRMTCHVEGEIVENLPDVADASLVERDMFDDRGGAGGENLIGEGVECPVQREYRKSFRSESTRHITQRS